MKYVQPYGEADTDAPYINGDPSIGRMGSIPPAAAFEHPMRELVTVIEGSQLTPDDVDLQQVFKGVRSQRMNYVEDTGSINTLSVAFDPPLPVYTIGLPMRVKIRETNTGSATIDAGPGRVTIKKPNGAELLPGDLPAGGLAELVYDGTNFQMINFGGAGGTGDANTFLVNIPYTVDTSPVANQIIANFSPAITAIQGGTIVMVKIAKTNTGPTTININSLGARPVCAQGGDPAIPMLPTDIRAGDVVVLTYDGTQFWVTANPIIEADCTFPVANNTDIATAFRALARKNIHPTVNVTIKLAMGTYTPIVTYHVDSSRIIVEGTMKAAVPTWQNFARTGNSAGARAQDSANNYAMLQSRYGSVISVSNAILNQGGAAIAVTGPGTPLFKNLLLIGENNGRTNFGAGIAGTQFQMNGVSIWGVGGCGIFGNNGSSIFAVNSFVDAVWAEGIALGTGASIIMTGCGIFGGQAYGVGTSTGGVVWLYQDCLIQMNGGIGAMANVAGTIWIGSGCVINYNTGWDVYAAWNSTVVTSGSADIYTASPPVGQEGNGGAVNAPGG
jgi:hypothetical protein